MNRLSPLTLSSSLAAALALGLAAPAAHAGEALVGVYAHEVDTPFTYDTYESGVDLQVGVRSEPIGALAAIGKPAAHLIASVNTAGDTSFVAAGLSWRIGVAGPVYVRPGIGLAVHDAPGYRLDPAGVQRTDFGSRVLFEPELAIGARLSERVSLEASWVHISNAQLLDSEQNPGLDTMGLRLGYRF